MCFYLKQANLVALISPPLKFLTKIIIMKNKNLQEVEMTSNSVVADNPKTGGGNNTGGTGNTGGGTSGGDGGDKV